jgi:hypothetical protein
VEGEIGRFRRRHLVPVPAAASLAALHQLIAAAGMVDDGRVITGRPVTIAAAFAEEQLAMMPLPAEPFDPARLLQARVDGRARSACGRTTPASRPAMPAGGSRCGCRPAAWRCWTGRRWWPGTSAPPGSTPRSWSWTTTWRSCATSPARCPGPPRWPRPGRPGPSPPPTRGTGTPRAQHGDAAGTRALIEVLLAHRTVPAAALEAAMTRAIGSGVLDAQAVLIDARCQAGRQVAPVIPIGALARYDRPAPALDAYDQLLTRSIP